MVAGQVGETAHREPGSVHAAQRQGVAGDLHDDGVHPLFGHGRQHCLQGGASGVVSALGMSAPSMRIPMVPISPAVRPAARSADSMRYVVVVLPDVPVTPTTVTRSDGFPYTAAASPPSTPRGPG